MRIEQVFSNVGRVPGVASPVLLFDSTLTPGDFAKDVGIANAQHLSRMLRGFDGRRTCRGWQGAYLHDPCAKASRSRPTSDDESEPPPKRPRESRQRVCAPPLGQEDYYVTCGSGFMTRTHVASGLLREGSAAHLRFEAALQTYPIAVPLLVVFPNARVEGPSNDCLVPMCSAGDFAKDVGIANAQHLARMLRGCDGRRRCHGWSGGLRCLSPSSAHAMAEALSPVSVSPQELQCLPEQRGCSAAVESVMERSETESWSNEELEFLVDQLDFDSLLAGEDWINQTSLIIPL